MQSFSPVVGQALRLKREPANAHDVHAIPVYYEVVGEGSATSSQNVRDCVIF